ncbi:hypothetical protein J6590_054542 [Homalodisca vitripennis]|nr:hypothetical protein J6590_054542 [Homalodisca vitripennis]
MRRLVGPVPGGANSSRRQSGCRSLGHPALCTSHGTAQSLASRLPECVTATGDRSDTPGVFVTAYTPRLLDTHSQAVLRLRDDRQVEFLPGVIGLAKYKGCPDPLTAFPGRFQILSGLRSTAHSESAAAAAVAAVAAAAAAAAVAAAATVAARGSAGIEQATNFPPLESRPLPFFM